MKGKNRILGILVLSLLLCLMAAGLVACNNEKLFTISFETNGGSYIEPIVAKAGAEITPPSVPKKSGYVFIGWYDNENLEGDKVEIPSVMPKGDLTFYAKYGEKAEVMFDANAEEGSFFGTMENIAVAKGETITIPKASFKIDGWYLAGWATTPDGEPDANYAEGRSFVLNGDITLYAVWKQEFAYEDKDGSGDKILLRSGIVGLGAVVLRRMGVSDKEGFIDLVTMEFTIYGQTEDDDIVGTLDSDTMLFVYADGLKGTYACYYYEFDKIAYRENLTLDGYGLALYSVLSAEGIEGRYYGYYEKADDGDDYVFTELDVLTQQPTGSGFYFMVEKRATEQEGTRGIFSIQGYESGSFYKYDNGELDEYQLQLNGYGGARLYGYAGDSKNLLAEGTYTGTENYENEYGEWVFTSSDESVSFRFILSTVSMGSQSYSVYTVFDEDTEGTYLGDGFSLYLDGYGGVYYTSGGIEQVGLYERGKSTLLTVTLYEYDENEEDYLYAGKVYFTMDWENGVAEKNPDEGYQIDGTVLTDYTGSSTIIEIPDGVTSINANVFSNAKISSKIVSVVIPASVESIGNCAFQNKQTLRLVTVLGTTPATLGVDAFRWTMGEFVILVPNGYGDTYRSAWSEYEDYIFTAQELANLPEFQTDKSGVLIRYNVKVENPSELELTIPDGITAIANGVFKGITYIKSINLNNVETLGQDVFALCSGLETVIAPNLKTIGAAAFQKAENLKSINLPAVRTIGAMAFYRCAHLTEVTLGEYIELIEEGAFSECGMVYTIDEETGLELAEQSLFHLYLTGDDAPEMGVKVFEGTAYRTHISSVAVALSKFYPNEYWRKYNVSLIVPAGSEAGTYYSTSTLKVVTLDGRIEMDGFYVMLYRISGSTITFYEFDKTEGLTTHYGEYHNGWFTISYYGQLRKYVIDGTTLTYQNGTDTLDITVAGGEPDVAVYDFDGEFNGNAVKVCVNYNKVYFDFDGSRHNLTLADGAYTETVKITPYVLNVTAADGSSLVISQGELSLSATGTIKDLDGHELTSSYWAATKAGEGLYVLTVPYQSSTTYSVMVTVVGGSFTYTVTLARTAKVVRASTGDLVTVYYDASNQIVNMTISFRNLDRTISTVNATYSLVSGSTYSFVVNDVVYVDDGETGVYEQPSPFNGTYLVTIDFENETCTIVKQ